jgi:hypothetical protein
MRRAPNGLVLVPSDNDEDIFVAVRVENEKRGTRFGLVARIGGEGFTDLRRIAGSFPERPCTMCKNSPARTTSGNATVSRAVALEDAPAAPAPTA